MRMRSEVGTNPKQKWNLLFWALMIGITVWRIWLQAHANYQLIYAPIDANADIDAGYALIHGDWMGSYRMMTLAKGYTYPLFLALLYVLHIPYGVGHGLLITGASLAEVGMLRTFTKNRAYLAGSYLFLLFGSYGIGHYLNMQIYRYVLMPWMSVLVVSSQIALYRICLKKRAWSVFWYVLGLISMIALLFLREDGIYLLPFYITSSVMIALRWLRGRRIGAVRCAMSLFLLLLPAGVYGSVRCGFAALNETYYGSPVVNDRAEGDFARMMGAFYSVKDDEADDVVWITKDMIGNCIRESPTLSSIEEEIWTSYQYWSDVYFPGTDMIYGDFMQWVLRNALYAQGYYRGNAPETQNIVAQIADELEQAFDEGRLEQDGKLHLSVYTRGMTLPRLLGYLPYSLRNMWKFLNNPNLMAQYPYYPMTQEAYVEKAAKLLRTDFAEETIESTAYKVSAWVADWNNRIRQHLAYVMAVIGIIAFGMVLVRCWKLREPRTMDALVCSLGIFGSVWILSFLVTVFITFMSDDFFQKYTSPNQPLLTLCLLVLLPEAKSALKGVTRKNVRN